MNATCSRRIVRLNRTGLLCALALIVASCLVQLAGVGTRPAAAAPADDSTASRVPPLPGPVLRGFQLGEQAWSPGHRGIDLGGAPGVTVVAAASGSVSWVGQIAGVPMLTVQHADGLRTTYQPVEAMVPVGAVVLAGQPIARLRSGHCTDQACLHLGLRKAESYLDPLAWLGGLAAAEVRLLPRSATPRPFPPPGVPESTDAESAVAGQLPTAGPVTSGFGGRANPLTGVWEFHDGIDIGAPCGSAVRTIWPGVVTFAGGAGGYGLRVEIDHGLVGGQGLTSSYSHLSGFAVSGGQHVWGGQLLGAVGSTGMSTGCHLHYATTEGAILVDPSGVG